MIILSVDKQAEVFLLSVFIGLGAAFLYDAIKILRILIPHTKTVCALEDCVYWVVCAVCMFNIMLKNNSGEIRLFSINGFFIAMIAYNLTLSKFIMSFSEKIIYVLKKIIMLFLEIIFTPFRLLWLIIRCPVKQVTNKAQKRSKSILILIKKYVKIYTVTAKARFRGIKK